MLHFDKSETFKGLKWGGRKTIKAYYGNTVLLKKYCPRCKMWAIVVKGEFQCCGAKTNSPEIERAIKKRESLAFYKRQRVSPKLKKEILEHQNYQCLYCGCSLRGKAQIAFDHFVPFSYSQENLNCLVASCRMCNSLKSSFIFNSVEEARIFIIEKRKQRGLPVYDYFGGSYQVIKI